MARLSFLANTASPRVARPGRSAAHASPNARAQHHAVADTAAHGHTDAAADRHPGPVVRAIVRSVACADDRPLVRAYVRS